MADEIATSFLSSMKAKGRKAMDWFKSIAKRTQRAAMPARSSRTEIMDDRNIGITSSISIGRMYLFQYDAKWKDKLPWWDMWPLILPFDLAKGGFYGINLHYLPPNDRADLLIRLIKAHGIGQLDEKFRMRLSYNVISRFGPAKPCIHRYLYTQVRGRGFYGISGEDWSYAAALPLQSFQKSTARRVWANSKQMY
jgi:hypothetical protein